MNKQYSVFSIYLCFVFANYGMDLAGQFTDIESLYKRYPLVEAASPHTGPLRRSVINIAESEYGCEAAQGILNAWNRRSDNLGWQNVSTQWKSGVAHYCIHKYPVLFATNEVGGLCFSGGSALSSLKNFNDDTIARNVGIYCYDQQIIGEEAQFGIMEDGRYYEEWKKYFGSLGIALHNATQKDIEYQIMAMYRRDLEAARRKIACATLARIVHSAPADTDTQRSIHEIWNSTERSLKLGAYAHAIMGYAEIVSQQSLARQ